MTIYDPQIDSDEPPEVQYFNENNFVRQLEETDGTVYFDDTHVFALVSPDTTVFGNGNTAEKITFEYEKAEYDRAEWAETKTNGNTKFWVFQYDGKDIAIQYKYIKMIREIFEMSLDEVRRNAHATVDEPGISPRAIVIESDSHEYRAMVMPHKALSDE